jgi:hypothetical protein
MYHWFKRRGTRKRKPAIRKDGGGGGGGGDDDDDAAFPKERFLKLVNLCSYL